MPSGAQVSLLYGWERYFDSVTNAWTGTYGTAGTENKVFGHGQKISSLERNNNIETIWGLGSRTAQVELEKQFTGSFSVEFLLSNPYFFRYVLGNGFVVRADAAAGGTEVLSTAATSGDTKLLVASTTDFVAGDFIRTYISTSDEEFDMVKAIVTDTSIETYSGMIYDHAVTTTTIDEWDSVAAGDVYIHSYGELDTLPSLTIQNSIDLSTDIKVVLLGCTNTTTSISAAINEPVTVTCDFAYANEALTEEAFISQTAETYDLFSFAHGTLYKVNKTGTTTTLSNIQSFDLDITQNAEVVYGLGNRVGQAALGKNRDYSIKITQYFESATDLLKLFYNGATGTAPGTVAEINMKLTFTNGEAGADERQIELLFGGVKIDTESLPQAVDAPVMEDVTMKARSMKVLAKNATAVIPA